MKIRKVVIPAAGLGTRLLPATKSQPKEMLPVGRKPVIQYVIEEICQSDLSQVLIVTGLMKRAIEDHFDSEYPPFKRINENEAVKQLKLVNQSVEIFYTRQSRPKGTADAILQAKSFVGGEPFVVAFGDAIIRTARGPQALLRRLMRVHQAKRPAATIAVEEVSGERISSYGVVKPKKDIKGHSQKSKEFLGTSGEFEIVDLIEKPQPDAAPSNFAIASRYIFEPIIFQMIGKIKPAPDGELQLTEAVKLLLKEGYSVWCVRLLPSERRYDIGNFESYFKAFLEIALEDPKTGQSLKDYFKQLIAK